MNIIMVFVAVSLWYSRTASCKEDPRLKIEDLEEAQSSSGADRKQYRENAKYGPVIFYKDTEDNADTMFGHKYIAIARENKIRTDNRYTNSENRQIRVKNHGTFKNSDRHQYEADSSPRIYRALAKHGAKVLRVPPEKLGKDHIPLTRDRTKKDNYAFFYKVVDRLTGDDFSHSQIRNSKVTNGEYRVKLPDGRVQIVSYTADKNGYKADVRYTEDDAVKEEDQFRVAHRDSPILMHREFSPVSRRIEASGRGEHAMLKLKALNAANALPTATPQSYDVYEDNLVSPIPARHPAAVHGNLQIPLPINVKIYTTNARDHSISSYIPFIASTTPYFHENIDDYQIERISPQIIHKGDQGIVVPAPTLSSFILTDQHGQVIDNIRLVTSTASPLVTTFRPSYFHPVYRGSSIASTAATPARYKNEIITLNK